MAVSYDVGSLDSLPAIHRLLTIAATDTLLLDASVLRGRLLVNIASTALKLFVLGEVERRLAAIEAIQTSLRMQQNGRREP